MCERTSTVHIEQSTSCSKCTVRWYISPRVCQNNSANREPTDALDENENGEDEHDGDEDAEDEGDESEDDDADEAHKEDDVGNR